MTSLITHHRKTEALKQLEQFFPHFTLSVSFSELAFFYDWLDEPDTDLGYQSVPSGFLLRDMTTGAVVLFSDGENDAVICHGVFSEPQAAIDLACDYFGSELHVTEFSPIGTEVLSTESVDN